jgi:hypothetical protein
MTTFTPTFPVDAPPIRPAVGGLISYADKPNDLGEFTLLVPGSTVPQPRPGAWEGGFAFDPYTCDPAIIVPLDCEGDPDNDDKLAAVGEHPGIVTYIPFQIVAADECSALSFEQLEERARSMLNVSQSYTLEHEFWTGEAMPENPALADGNATVLGSGPLGLQEALALIDQAVSASEQGAPGMIHVTPYMLARIVNSEGGAIRWAGDRYVTANGNTIVPGSGYTGGAPRPNPGDPLPTPPDLLSSPPDNEWIYGTGAVVVRLGGIVRVTDDLRDQLNRRNNTVRYIFERSAAAYYSPCTQFAAEVDLTPT